ncbi:TetR/AcrR family transcriptional regulator [Roseovarius sp. 2305UL8-3]|uniref:TetR/AcrR family transcriptional regulator n=1 Tax=Roseovarius conchicola TaxID=3121636 RepID=UPI0035296182
MPRKPLYDRDDLIVRARDLFWARGWAGTSMKDLEAALKLNPGSFYAAFGSKEALYELALDRYAEEGAAGLRKLAEDLGPLEALQAHPLRVLERKGAATACMLSKTFLELQAQAHPLAARAGAHLDDMEAVFASLFEEAQTRGQISADHDPKRLARRYQSDLLGLRVSSERPSVDAWALATEIANGVEALRKT